MATKKVYLNPTGVNQFEYVDSVQDVKNPAAKKAAESTLKQLHGATLEEAPRKVQQVDPGWVITTQIEV